MHICTDKCGNATAGLYSYIQIGEGSGILSAITATSTTSDDSTGGNTPSTRSSKSIATVTVNRGTTVVITSFFPSEPTMTIAPTQSQGSGASSLPGNPLSSAGPSTNSDPSSQTPDIGRESSSFWNAPGKVAGVFVTVGVIILLLGIAMLWMFRRRKTTRKDEEKELPKPITRQNSMGQTVSRSTSLLQLLGKREKNRPEVAPVPSASGGRVSRSPTNLAIPTLDQRLDPQSMMNRFEDNDSRVSFRDEDDYSRRVWRITNASDSDSLRSTEIDTGR
jgi:hypothetical protein